MLYVFTIYYFLGCWNYIEFIKYFVTFLTDLIIFCSLVRMSKYEFLTIANISEILENNERLDIISITYTHSLGGSTY